MKKQLLGLLVGLFVLGLSGIASAEEWRKVEIEEPFHFSFVIPKGLILIEEKKLDNGTIGYWYEDSKNGSIVMLQIENIKVDHSEHYILEDLPSEKQEEFLKIATKGESNFLNHKFTKLAKGRVVIVGMSKEPDGVEVIGFVETYRILMRIAKIRGDDGGEFSSSVLESIEF